MAKEAGEDVVVAGESAEKPSRKKPLMMGGILLGVMLLEGVGVFVLAKHFGAPPAVAKGEESVKGLDPKGGEKAPVDTEVEVLKLRAQNEKSQVPCTYDIAVAINISEKDALRVTDALNKKKATVQDRLSRVVRSLDPQRFTEPDLATLRQQFKHELSQVVGEEGGIKEVLIPSIVRYNEN